MTKLRLIIQFSLLLVERILVLYVESTLSKVSFNKALRIMIIDLNIYIQFLLSVAFNIYLIMIVNSCII